MNWIIKMKSFSLIFCFFSFLVAFNLNSQTDQFIPRNVKLAYDKGTRSYDGKPGPNYWQNKSEYLIEVKFIPSERLIIGKSKIIYHNNSPDTLNQLVFRLYQDYFKKGFPREFRVHPDDIHDGVKINKLKISDKEIFINEISVVNRIGTNLIIHLTDDVKISPKSKSKIEVEWESVVPKHSNIRMGTYDSTTFFIGYWYPQIAVYDDIDGWDLIPYTGTVEFYNDFNDYDIKITVPKNFIVWATGELQNPTEVFSKEIQEKYYKAQHSDSVIHIVSLEDLNVNKLKTQNFDWIKYHFKAIDVPDFAFALSDHYLWDATSLVVDSSTNRRVFISSAYRSSSRDFYDVAKISRDIIEYFSNVFPQIPYPYPAMTVFNGHGGMEFPMMCNNGSVNSYVAALGLAAHEIAHTYFPFYMGINEKKYAWMDEGFAVMLPFDLQERYSEGEDGPRERNALTYENNSGYEDDVPLMTLSYLLKGNAYRNTVYRKAACAYDILREILGKEQFIKALKEFAKFWNGKHPTPYDFFETFNRVSGEKLDWFWQPWFYEKSVPDLSLTNVLYKQGELSFDIINKSKLPVPIYIKITFEDNKNQIFTDSALYWSKKDKYKFITKLTKKPIMIEIGNRMIPDINRVDNEFYFIK